MGRGVAADRESGIAWLELAAAQGDANACFNLGTAFHKDNAAPADLARAAEFYERAARLGHFPSQARLGYLYSHGKGVEKNRVQAFVWLSLAAQHGVGSVLNELEALGAQMSIEERREGMGRLEEWRSRNKPVGPPPRMNPVLG
jgi:TPR repeat protein